jgi:hypothetical protein
MRNKLADIRIQNSGDEKLSDVKMSFGEQNIRFGYVISGSWKTWGHTNISKLSDVCVQWTLPSGQVKQATFPGSVLQFDRDRLVFVVIIDKSGARVSYEDKPK